MIAFFPETFFCMTAELMEKGLLFPEKGCLLTENRLIRKLEEWIIIGQIYSWFPHLTIWVKLFKAEYFGKTTCLKSAQLKQNQNKVKFFENIICLLHAWIGKACDCARMHPHMPCAVARSTPWKLHGLFLYLLMVHSFSTLIITILTITFIKYSVYLYSTLYFFSS